MVAICVLSPISAKKKVMRAEVKAPERLIDCSSRSYLSGKIAHTATARNDNPNIRRIHGPASRLPKKGAGQTGGGVIGSRSEQDAEQDWHGPMKAGGGYHGENLRLVADLGEADDHGRDEEGFHGMPPLGQARDETLAPAPSPDPGAGNRCQRSRQTFWAACAMAEAKCVDADPAINAGGYSPMTRDL
jgi:hypothetical protein